MVAMTNESNSGIYAVSYEMFEVNFIPSLAPAEKLPFGSFLHVQSDLSFRVLSRRSTDHHVARTRSQPCDISRYSPMNRPQYARYGKLLKKHDGEAPHSLRIDRSCEKLW